MSPVLPLTAARGTNAPPRAGGPEGEREGERAEAEQRARAAVDKVELAAVKRRGALEAAPLAPRAAERAVAQRAAQQAALRVAQRVVQRVEGPEGVLGTRGSGWIEAGPRFLRTPAP